MSDIPRGDGRRRLNGWGFVGQSYPPSTQLLEWLRARLGDTEPFPCREPRLDTLPRPRRLPELGVARSAEPLDRLAHARGQGLPDVLRQRTGTVSAVPDAVVRPGSADEVEAVLGACAAAGVMVIPWGGGTSVTGGVNALPGPHPVVSLDLGRLSKLKAIDPISGLATFGAGASGPRVESALAEHGFTLGHFPQSWELATLGGWVVTRSSGQESLGYGRIENLVAGLCLAAPAGRLEAPALPASAAGPDLRHLVMGSEGRLGVVTEVTVRVRPIPAKKEVAACLLPAWSQALEAVRQLLGDRVPLSLLRLSDGEETEVVMAVGLAQHRFGALARRWLAWRGLNRGCLLLCGVDGDRSHRRRTLARASAVLGRHGAAPLGKGPGRRWLEDRFRHPYLRDALLDRGVATDTLETAAPWSRLGALRRAVQSALADGLEEEGEKVAVLCHLSHPYPDGASLYFTFFFRCPSDPEAAIARWARLKRSATEALVEAGGTLSHHHGVGSWHAPWLSREIGPTGVRLLEGAARCLDPAGVMNPSVLLDPIDRLEA